MTIPDNVNYLMHLLLSVALGIMLWRLCYNSRGTMAKAPQLWAASAGFVLAWLAQSLPQVVTGQPLSQGMLPVDYAGILLGQGLATLYLWLSRRPAPHPLLPVAQQVSAADLWQACRPQLVLLTEAEGPVPVERAEEGFFLKLVA